MEASNSTSGMNPFKQTELLLSVGLLGILMVIIVPLPTLLLDTFLAANLSMSVVLLLITLNISHPLEISVFPSLLLLLTLARLSLNVATTRLILLNADAGRIVSTFGGFVVGGDIVVGMVIFLILVVIQFIVITKGASRVSEVAARFALDALPGKQMAIDAELGAGTIDEKEAQERRSALSLETEFYGSMDGAGKFVRGDAMAGLVITGINLVGGVITGVMKGLSVPDAIRTYSVLTVGDGLVSQIPGLIIATMAGLLVTKASSKISLGKEIGTQLSQHQRAILIGAGIMFALALVPGFPKIPFVVLSAILLAFWWFQSQAKETDEPEPDAAPVEPVAPNRMEQHVQQFLQTEQACVEIGVRLVPLVGATEATGLIARIAEMRTELAEKHGMWVPAVRVRDNIRLHPSAYRVIVNGRVVAKAELEMDSLLAIAPSGSLNPVELEGKSTKDPAFGLPATWVPKNQKARATRNGYTVVDPTTVLITHLGELLRKFAPELLSREDLTRLLDELKKTAPTLVDELRPDVLRVGDLHVVLRQLLSERIPITNMGLILESCLQHANKVGAPEALAEMVRVSLGRELMDRCQDQTGAVNAVIVEPQLETRLRDMIQDGVLALPPASMDALTRRLGEIRQTFLAREQEVILLIESSIRRSVRNAIERSVPDLMVVGYSEVPRDVQVELRQMLKMDEIFPEQDVRLAGGQDDQATLHAA